MATKRELKAMLKSLSDPPPMTMTQALASENPLYEIEVRIRGKFEEFTPSERRFWASNYFWSDTLNGGLHQTLSNDTGYWTETIHDLVRQYCCPEVEQIFAELKALFPSGAVPQSREARNDVLDEMELDDRSDRLDQLTGRLYKLEDEFQRGLLSFAVEHSEDFRGFT